MGRGGPAREHGRWEHFNGTADSGFCASAVAGNFCTKVIGFDPSARRELEKLDKSVSGILKFLHQRIANLDDPAEAASGFKGP
jgi:hypothetical protein